MYSKPTGWRIPKAVDWLLSGLDDWELDMFLCVCKESVRQGAVRNRSLEQNVDGLVRCRECEVAAEAAVKEHKNKSAPRTGRTAPLSANRQKQIRAMHDQGIPKTTIADELGIDRKTVDQYAE